MHHRRSLAAVFAAGFLSIAVLAGAGSPAHAAGDTGPADDQAAGMSFATEEEALSWIAQRADELGLEMSARKDKEGKIVGLSGMTIGTPAEVAEKHAQLLQEIGRAERAVHIAGKRFSLQSEAESDLGTTALCSSDLCTSHSSFRNNYLLYREIGSRTNVTSGGFEFQRQTWTRGARFRMVAMAKPRKTVLSAASCWAAGGLPS